MEFAVEGCPHKAKKMLDGKEGMWKENIFCSWLYAFLIEKDVTGY